MKTLILTLLLLLHLAGAGFTDEPLWTNEQRLARRDVVCFATVITTEKVSAIDQHNDLFLAKIKVESMQKGPKTAVGSTLRVYYEFSPTGKNIRCPAYAELKAGDQNTFYLRPITDAIQQHLGLTETEPNDLFLEMGSDVQPPKNAAQPGATGSTISASEAIRIATERWQRGNLPLTNLRANRDRDEWVVRADSQDEQGRPVVRIMRLDAAGNWINDGSLLRPSNTSSE